MNKIITDGTVEYYLALVTAFLIPVYHWYVTPVFILWGIVFILNIKRFIKDFSSGERNKKLLLVLFISFYLWQIIGLLYSDNLKDGFRNISLRLPLLLMPLVLSFPGDKLKNRTGDVLKVFLISTFLFFIFSIGFALKRSVYFYEGVISFNPHPPVEDWLNYFYASELAVFQHPSYLSMYAILGMFIGLQYFQDNALKLWQRIIYLFISISLIVDVYLLSSRAEILAVLFCIIIYLFYKLNLTYSNKFKYLIPVFLSVIIVLCLLSNPRINKITDFSSTGSFKKALNESRIYIWESSFKLIKNNLLLGVGTGDIQDSLNEEYKLSGNEDLLKVKNLNTHNQFIEILTENGLIGLILFLFVILIMLKIAWGNRSILYFIFVVLVIISIFFETMLNRLGGLSFISFFSIILIYNKAGGFDKHLKV